MRNTGTVSQREFPLDENETLLSTTDLKGRIVYANEAFIRISGYTREELYGKAHNIVRHPDMPPAAFADLWDTLTQGQTWTGVVKNRRKNGDHYWVRANVTPVRERGEVVGYLSVRTKPTDAEIHAHEAVYRSIQSGDTLWCVHQGRAFRTRWCWAVRRWYTMSIASRIRLALGSVVLSTLGTPVWALSEGTAPWGAWLLTLPVWGVAAVMLWWLHRSVVVPLRQVEAEAQAVASGQRAQSLLLHRADEVGLLMRGIEQAGLNLIALVGDIQQKSALVNDDAVQMQHGNQDLSHRAEQAAANLQQTAAAMEQLAATIQSNTATTSQASALAGEAEQVATQGAELVGHVKRTMAGIASSSQRVADITSLIDGIAFQTNILALNAAVEAARAGEHGRGFAVVASEVRALSNKSAEAAREIKTLIDASRQQVLSGDHVVEQATQAMGSVLGSVQRLTGLLNEIRVATHEQSEGVQQINVAVSQLDQMTQQNAALAEKSTTVSLNLTQQAQELDDATAVFKFHH